MTVLHSRFKKKFFRPEIECYAVGFTIGMHAETLASITSSGSDDPVALELTSIMLA